MSLLNDLTGGGYDKSLQTRDKKRAEAGTYNVYMKFDNDEETVIFKDINNLDMIVFEIIKSDSNSAIEFVCPKTNKKLKIYCK